MRLRQYGNEYQFECAVHANCIFAFKYILTESGFKFRLSRGYH